MSVTETDLKLPRARNTSADEEEQDEKMSDES